MSVETQGARAGTLTVVEALWRKELLCLRRAPKTFAWSIASTFLGGAAMAALASALIFSAPRPATSHALAIQDLARVDPVLVDHLTRAGFRPVDAPGDVAQAVRSGHMAAGLQLARASDGEPQVPQLFLNRNAAAAPGRRDVERLELALADYQAGAALAAYELRDLGSQVQRVGTMMALACTFLLGGLMTSGMSGTRTAIKVGANEREHKALEPLLATPASSGQILLGKLSANFTLTLLAAPLVLAGYAAGVWLLTLFGVEATYLLLSLRVLAGVLPLGLAFALCANVLFVSLAFGLGGSKQLGVVLSLLSVGIYALMVVSFNRPPVHTWAFALPFYGLAASAQALAAGMPLSGSQLATAIGGSVGGAALAFVLVVASFDRERETYTP